MGQFPIPALQSRTMCNSGIGPQSQLPYYEPRQNIASIAMFAFHVTGNCSVIRPSTMLFAIVAAIAASTATDRVSAQEVSPTPSPAPTVSPSPSRLRLRLTPYVWVPTINGTFDFHHPSLPLGSTTIRSVGVQLGPNSYLSKLNSAVELTVEADVAHSVAFGDVIYINASNTGATVFDLSGSTGHVTFPVNVSTSARMTTTLATVALGARLIGNGETSEGTAFVGLRYADVSAKAGWTLTGPLGSFPSTGTADENETDLAGIVGARGRIGLGSSWFVPLYADFGGSGDLTTYQWIGGIAHSYHSGAQILAWRQLGYIGNTGNTTLIQTLHLGGPTFAWTFYL